MVDISIENWLLVVAKQVGTEKVTYYNYSDNQMWSYNHLLYRWDGNDSRCGMVHTYTYSFNDSRSVAILIIAMLQVW